MKRKTSLSFSRRVFQESVVMVSFLLLLLSPAALKRANPDVVVTEVAAIGPKAYEDIQAALATVLGKSIMLVNWKADSLDGVWAMMKRMFYSLNSGVQGDRILESLSERYALEIRYIPRCSPPVSTPRQGLTSFNVCHLTFSDYRSQPIWSKGETRQESAWCSGVTL